MYYLNLRFGRPFSRLCRKVKDRLKTLLSLWHFRGYHKPAPLAVGVAANAATPTKQIKCMAYEANRLNRLLCETYGAALPVSFPTAVFPAVRLKLGEKAEVLYGDGSVRRWFEIAPKKGALLVEYELGEEEQCLELAAGAEPCRIAAEKVRLAAAEEAAVCDVTVK